MTSVSIQWIKENIHQESALFIDVRERHEYHAEHIKNAMNIPLGALEQSIDRIPKDKTLIFYCKSGNRSQKALEQLIHHLSDIPCYSLIGGIDAGKKEFEIERSSTTGCKMRLSVERQTFVIIGIFLILGGIFAFTINPLFQLVPFVIGGGMIFAGLSGFCGLSKVLAMMPWNK